MFVKAWSTYCRRVFSMSTETFVYVHSNSRGGSAELQKAS